MQFSIFPPWPRLRRANNLQSSSSGFTMIEVLISIFVIVVAVVAIYSILPRVISAVSSSAERLIAAQLAAEGMEIIRNIRDSNWLKEGVNWNKDLTVCAGGCEIAYNDSTPVPYSARSLRIDNQGFYNYDTGQPTKFKRKLTLSYPESHILNIKIEVAWEGKGSPFLLEENLYNWR